MRRAALLLFGTLVGLGLAEALLAAFGLPVFLAARETPPQFDFVTGPGGEPMHVNAPLHRIRFVYDGNPRGAFGPENEVDHWTNAWGFRGGAFREAKPEKTFRLVFLGDSFTFGEGVWFEDTYPERTAALLQARRPAGGWRFESYNLGVGGYNTADALRAFEVFGERLAPDAVVLGFTPNDAEPPLFAWDAAGQRFVHEGREALSRAGQADARPPDTLPYRLRTVRLVWKARAARARARRVLDGYRALYAEDSPGWTASRSALESLAQRCREHGVGLYVVVFPLLHGLDGEYPLAAAHARVLAAVRAAGAVPVDLLPRLRGRDPETLWVHPTDQHPNERVHEEAARALVEVLEADGALGRVVPSA